MKTIFSMLLLLFLCTKANAQERRISQEEGFDIENVHAIHKDQHGLMWIGTNHGLMCFDGLQLMPIPIGDGSCNILDINEANGEMLITTSTEQLVLSNGIVKDRTPRGHENQSTTRSYGFYHDAELGIDWQGYFLKGFSYTPRVANIFHQYAFGTLETNTLDLRSFRWHDADLLLGTRCGAIHIDTLHHHIQHINTSELHGEIVTNIRWFKDRFVLAVYEGGLCTYNPKTRALQALDLATSDGKHIKEVHCSRIVLTPNEKEFVVCTSEGLFWLNDQWQVVRHLNHRNSALPNEYIIDLHFDANGIAWIATTNRLCIYDPQKDRILTENFPTGYFHNEPLLSFNEQSKDSLFVFSPSNVYLTNINRQDWRRIAVFDNLETKGVNFILPVDSMLWVGANGLFILDKDYRPCQHFSKADGLPSMTFNKQEWQWQGDTLWVATTCGLAWANRRQMRTEIPAQIVLTDLRIDQRHKGSSDFLTLLASHELCVKWNLGTEEVTFKPLLLDYAEQRDRYYQWSLDGETWHTVRSGQDVTLPPLGVVHIKPYKLHLRLLGHPETTTYYAISVKPSSLFYFEALFIILLSIVAFVAGQRLRHSWHKYRERQLRKQQQSQRVSQEDFDSLAKKLESVMTTEKPYRQQQLRLTDLARMVETSPTTLSQLFNQHLNTNFFDYINEYRLNDFKQLILDEQYSNYTINAISELCGFKKTNFFTFFKKKEGCSPGDYIKQMRK